jgi:DNA-binding GntR family transcriptional regulator
MRQFQREQSLPHFSESTAEPLVKHTVAERLGREIASGALRPGERIVEATWARKFGVAQGSIREAINLLAQDGFVTKAAGRSARVVNLSGRDVLQIFELRSGLEGLAVRLVTQRGCDIRPLEEILDRMRQALHSGRREELIDADLKFHLELCSLSGNSYLLEHARKVLLPLFAFVRIRVLSSGQDAALWEKEFEAHQRILDLVKDGQGDVAEQYVHHAMSRFAQNAYENWGNESAFSRQARARRSSTQRAGQETPTILAMPASPTGIPPA